MIRAFFLLCLALTTSRNLQTAANCFVLDYNESIVNLQYMIDGLYSHRPALNSSWGLG